MLPGGGLAAGRGWLQAATGTVPEWRRAAGRRWSSSLCSVALDCCVAEDSTLRLSAGLRRA